MCGNSYRFRIEVMECNAVIKFGRVTVLQNNSEGQQSPV